MQQGIKPFRFLGPAVGLPSESQFFEFGLSRRKPKRLDIVPKLVDQVGREKVT